jgi:hypothetical protein
MLRTVNDLLRAGALSSGLLSYRAGDSVAQLTARLRNRYKGSFAARTATVQALYRRASAAARAADRYAFSAGPTEDQVPLISEIRSRTRFQTRVTISITETKVPQGENPITRFHSVILGSSTIMTVDEIKSRADSIVEQLVRRMDTNEQFALASREWKKPKIDRIIEAVTQHLSR